MTTKRISASILSANFAHLGKEVKTVLNAGANLIHLDIMDNHYVPNLTFGPMVCQALRNDGITAPFDVHLMVKPVDELIISFAKAGATTITFHPEASEHIDRSLQLIHDHGCRAGLAFNPATPLNYLNHVLNKLDNILIMSVNPGFGGQAFIPEALNKIKQAREIINNSKRLIDLSVDGGVKIDNIHQIAKAGADTFIVGSAIFNTPDYAATLAQFKTELAK